MRAKKNNSLHGTADKCAGIQTPIVLQVNALCLVAEGSKAAADVGAAATHRDDPRTQGGGEACAYHAMQSSPPSLNQATPLPLGALVGAPGGPICSNRIESTMVCQAHCAFSKRSPQ